MPPLAYSCRIARSTGLALTVVASACRWSNDGSIHTVSSDSVIMASSTGIPRRMVEGVAWDTLLRLPQTADSDRPGKVRWLGDHFVYFSDGSRRLMAIDAAGYERWALGPRLPSGDSLAAVADLRVLKDGRIAALDARSNRLILVRIDGTVQAELDLASLGRATDVVELDAGRLLVLTPEDSMPFAVVSASGRVVQRLRFPNPRYNDVHALARAGVLGGGAGGRWVFGFRLGNGLVAFRDTIPGGPVAAYPESVRFPSVLEEVRPGFRSSRLGRITRTASAITVLRDQSFVLFGGESPDHGRIIDVYRFPSSSYAYSFRLPDKAVDLSSFDEDLIVLTGGAHRTVLRLKGTTLGDVARR
jgi:hypothetical protein